MGHIAKTLNRVSQLIADGYLQAGDQPNTVVLTPKGMAVLMALADRPISKSELKDDK